jgi:hypothetical protein
MNVRSGGGVHITVATGGVEGRTSLDVAHETALVKAALLYADHVTLASPRVSFLASVASILVADEAQRADVALQLVQVLPEGADVAGRINALRRKRRPSVDERFLLRDLQQRLRETGAELAERVESILTDSGVAELATAIGAGVLDLDPLGFNDPRGMEDVAYRLGDLLAKVVSPGATTYPLLDESTNSLLKAMIREGAAPAANLRAATEPTLASRWIGELQAFPDAAIETVLEAREALASPLVRFRAAMVTISTKFEATPLDDRFAREAAEAFRQEVAPALEELRELAAEDSVTRLLLHPTTVNATRAGLGGLLGVVGATSVSLPAIVGAAVGVAGDIGASMYARHYGIGAKRRENAFLFLYEANRQLVDR